MRSPARVLLVIGTPLPSSFVHAIAAAYRDGAELSGAHVKVIDLSHDVIPAHPKERDQLRAPRSEADVALDREVAGYLDDVRWADRVTFVYPQWWGTYPAAMKAFIDRVFISGATFRYHERGRGWDKLLTGRKATLIMTMDSPRWWNRLRYRNAAETSLVRAILAFCGVRTTSVIRFSEVRHRSDEQRQRWLGVARSAGQKDGEAVSRLQAETRA